MEDVKKHIFTDYLLLSLQDLRELNIRAVKQAWEQSEELGTVGALLRAVINANSAKAIHKLTKAYPYLNVYAGDEQYLDLIKIWRLRKLAKATRKCKDKKLARLMREEEYKSLYWLLGEDFFLTLKKTKCFALYLRWYQISVAPNQPDLAKITRQFLRVAYQMNAEPYLSQKVKEILAQV